MIWDIFFQQFWKDLKVDLSVFLVTEKKNLSQRKLL